MKIIILGPQASGKGTQANMLSNEFDIPHISTGDIFRDNIKNLTELGKLALSYTNKGALVPDDVTNKIVADRLSQADCSEGFILDGYPRNIEQAEFLDTIVEVDKVLEIKVSDDEAIKRISGRRTCEKCGAVFSIYQTNEEDLTSACKKCGGKLIIRDDDTESAVRKRLEIYHEQTEPIVDYYRKKQILVSINGKQSIEKIFEIIKKKLRN